MCSLQRKKTVEPSLNAEDDATVNPSWHLNTMVAYTLFVDGRVDRANYLIDRMLKTMQSLNRVRGRSAYGAWDAAIHAIRGDNQQAISALVKRAACDTASGRGWDSARSLRELTANMPLRGCVGRTGVSSATTLGEKTKWPRKGAI